MANFWYNKNNTRGCSVENTGKAPKRRRKRISHGLTAIPSGLCRTAEDRQLRSVWSAMILRCEDPKRTHWHRYGGRGIKVCDRWKQFDLFRQDMGYRPGDRYQLDRVDNDGDYGPHNCRWIDRKENCRNRFNNRVLQTSWGSRSLWQLGLMILAFALRR